MWYTTDPPRALSRAIESQTRNKTGVNHAVSKRVLHLLLATLLTGCGSSSAPPTLKSGPELVLVTNYGTHTGQPYTVSAFSLSSSNGILTQVSGSPFSVGNAPNSLAVDPAGKFAYVADLGSFDITILSIGSGGVLAAVAGSPFPTGN